MKITAEFSSNEELLSFISTFGTKTIATGQAVKQVVANEPKVKEDTKKEAPEAEAVKENKKGDIPKVAAEVVGVDQKTSEIKDTESTNEETNITKEMVRAIFTKLIKAGKQKEAKEITEKYGAKRLPDLKEEHYAAAYKDVEGLL